MKDSPHGAPLYRSLSRVATVVAIAVLFAGTLRAQFARKATPSKGPRAIGLLQLAANGKGHLVPVVIMVDGKFYDASAYKATPVPMALDSGTVYEAERSGVTQGLFTISVARQLKDSWIGDGSFQLPGAPTKAEKKTDSSPKPSDDALDSPPKLKRPGSKGTEPPPSSTPTEEKPSKPAASATAAAPAAPAEPPPDPNRPKLRRGVPERQNAQSEAEAELPPTTKGTTTKEAPPPASQSGAVEINPAISDASGPQPQPYTYEMKATEQQQLQKKMLDLAAAQLAAYRKEKSGNITSEAAKPGARKPAAAKPVQPDFSDVQLHVFDLSNSNEPTVVLEATARRAEVPGSMPSRDYYITLVARDDIYGELHKAFAGVTDNQHLDVLPRLELIDAIDADGDGRGELLFRQVSDVGSSYAIYRVIGDQLYALYEGSTAQ